MEYRSHSRQCHKSAKEELATNADHRLKYAALALRMAMECLTYDRALAYKDEFPPKEYETWQPKKVMAVLLEIDSNADKDSSLAFGIEDFPGVPATEMRSMGSEKVLSMALLKKHYDALGSYLHVQSMKQARDGAPLDYGKMRSRCEEISAFVEQVLASPIFNVTLGNFSSIACMKCTKSVRKRLPFGKRDVEAICYECDASYTIIVESDESTLWEPHQHQVECANQSCRENFLVWRRELEVGRDWECNACKGRNVFAIGIRHVPRN